MKRFLFGRRDILRGSIGLIAPFGPLVAAPLAGCSSDDDDGDSSADVFRHGVASGDPVPDSVILWTRVTPEGESATAAPLDVEWEVAEDPAMEKRVAGGSARTDADRDFTV